MYSSLGKKKGKLLGADKMGRIKNQLIELASICIETKDKLPKEPFLGQSVILEEDCERLVWNGVEWINIREIINLGDSKK